MNYNNFYKVAKKGLNDLKYFLPTKKIPENLIWFLTERCSLKCTHCFVSHKGRQYRDELDTESILLILKNANNFLKKISFTGGEPLIFRDFEDIYIYSTKLKNLSQLHLSTNGMHNQIIFNILDKINNSNINFQIQSSLDGLKDNHNAIRGNKKSFDNVLKLFDGLNSYKKFLKIETNVVMTCSKSNIAQIEETMVALSEINTPLSINFVRSSAEAVLNNNEKNDFIPMNDVGLEILEVEKIILLWKKIFANKLDIYTYSLNKIKLENTLNFYKTKKWNYLCSAGISDAVLFSDGSISMCETKKSIDNIKNYNYDYKLFWQKHYQSKMHSCYCNYDCAAIYSVSKSIKGQSLFLKELFKNLFVKVN